MLQNDDDVNDISKTADFTAIWQIYIYFLFKMQSKNELINIYFRL